MLQTATLHEFKFGSLSERPFKHGSWCPGSPVSSGNDAALPPAPSSLLAGTWRTTCSLLRGLGLLGVRGDLPSDQFAKVTGGGRRSCINSRGTDSYPGLGKTLCNALGVRACHSQWNFRNSLYVPAITPILLTRTLRSREEKCISSLLLIFYLIGIWRMCVSNPQVRFENQHYKNRIPKM